MQKIIYICDDCEEEFAAEAGLGFKEAWDQAKAEGWICYKDRDTDEWKHKCEECK